MKGPNRSLIKWVLCEQLHFSSPRYLKGNLSNEGKKIQQPSSPPPPQHSLPQGCFQLTAASSIARPRSQPPTVLPYEMQHKERRSQLIFLLSLVLQPLLSWPPKWTQLTLIGLPSSWIPLTSKPTFTYGADSSRLLAVTSDEKDTRKLWPPPPPLLDFKQINNWHKWFL